MLFALGLAVTSAEARGFGGGFHGPGFAPRVGAWGRPQGPVRPGIAFGGIGRPGFAVRPDPFQPHWRRGYRGYGYGLGGLGFGLGLGGLLGTYADPWYDEPYVFVPPVETTVEVEVAVPEESAAIAACARRFRTYDPVTQTYVGKGYVRRRCP